MAGARCNPRACTSRVVRRDTVRLEWIVLTSSLMNGEAKRDYEARGEVLKLLSDAEVARVSTAEGEAHLRDGDEYIDLAAPLNGVRRVHGAMQQTMGRVLPRNAVSAETWARIAARFGTRFAPKPGK